MRLPELSELAAFSMWDATLWAAFLSWCGWTARWQALRDRSRGDRRGWRSGVKMAAALLAAAAALQTAGVWWMPHRGPGVWGTLATVCLVYVIAAVEGFKRTGKAPF